jgi:hypothetical protein
MDALLDGEAEKLTRKAVDMALNGDTTALRLCLERIAPARRDRPIPFELPPLVKATDAVQAAAAVMAAVAQGELTPLEAGEFSKLIDSFTKALEVSEIEARLAKLEDAAQ